MTSPSVSPIVPPRPLLQTLRDFSQNPMRAGRELRDALRAGRYAFIRELLSEEDLDVSDRGFRYSIVLLMNGDALIPAIATSSATTLPEALRLARGALKLDPNFINMLVGGLVMRPDLRDAGRILRVLEIVGECAESLANWRSLARLRNDDPKVRRKCAALLARFRFADRAGLERFRSCTSRVRANIVQTLWDENHAKAGPLLDAAFDDYDHRVVGNACLALYQAGDTRALVRLAEMLESPKPTDQITAAWVAGQCRDGRLAGPLQKASKSPVSDVTSITRESLARLEPIPDFDVQTPLGPPPVPQQETVPVFVSSPVTATWVCETELWLRVKGPQSGFLSGIRPVDFFVCTGAETISDYSVTESEAKGPVTVCLVYPVTVDSLAAAIKTSLAAKPARQYWAICTYSQPSGSASNGPVTGQSPLPESDAAILATQIDAGPPNAAGVEAAVQNVLNRRAESTETHVFLVLDGPRSPHEWEKMRLLCAQKSATLHVVQLRNGTGHAVSFPCLVRDEAETCLLWPEWMAALENRYVLRSKHKPTGVSIRNSETSLARFSRRIRLLDGAKG